MLTGDTTPLEAPSNDLERPSTLVKAIKDKILGKKSMKKYKCPVLECGKGFDRMNVY
jgi:hypothetical protein